MKHLLLTLFGLIVFSLSAFAIDPAPPHVLITVINIDGVKIDSVYISSDSVFVHEEFDHKLESYGSKDLTESIWGSVWNGCFRVKVKLTNSTVFTSALIHDEERYTQYDLKVSADGIAVEKNYDQKIREFVQSLLLFILFAFGFRIFVSFVKLQMVSKRNYVLKYSAISFINLSAIYASISFIQGDAKIILILVLSFIVPSLIDYSFYKRDKNIIKYSVPTLIFANIIFNFIQFPIYAFLWIFGFFS